MNIQKIRLGFPYIIVGALFIADLVYLSFYSFDGEAFAIFLFPIGLLAIAFIFKGFVVVFSSPSASNQVVTTANYSTNSRFDIGSKALKSNLIVPPLVYVCAYIVTVSTGDSDLGFVLLWFGGIAAAGYFALTVIIYVFSSKGTDTSPLSNKRIKTGFNILFAFTLFLTIASLFDYLRLIKHNATQERHKVVSAFIDNLEIGSTWEVRADFYKKTTGKDLKLNLYDIAEGPTREAFMSCRSAVKTDNPSSRGWVRRLYYMDEVLVLKFLPAAGGPPPSPTIEYDTRIITFNNETVTICGVNFPRSDLFDTFEIYDDNNLKLIPVNITGG